jgi:nicotinate-nucleotide adenylyltransferase
MEQRSYNGRRRMAIGVFGGTFDPVHLGHLRIAEEVRETFSLDRVYFVPARVQPLKVAAGCAGADERVRMLKMSLAGNAFFRASSIEIKRGGISYSIDTVRHFARRFGQIYFIMGMDAFLDIGRWKDWPELLSTADLVVMVRPGMEFSGFPAGLKRQVRKVGEATYEHASGRRIYMLRITQLDISSTRIRELARTGRSIKYLVSASVERYIISRGLYGG